MPALSTYCTKLLPETHCKKGVQFTLAAFENFSTLSYLTDFTSCNTGGNADSAAIDRRAAYFPQFFAFLQFPCIFSCMLKFI